MANETSSSDILVFTAQIVSAHVKVNEIAPDTLPDLIKDVHRALSSLGNAAPLAPPERPQPAVPIKKSVYPDYIVCLEDGRKLKMLKRHLMSGYGLTPNEYRERWGLSSDYPMVAPNYAQHRSSLAKKIGLGTGGRSAAARNQFTAARAVPARSSSCRAAGFHVCTFPGTQYRTVLPPQGPKYPRAAKTTASDVEGEGSSPPSRSIKSLSSRHGHRQSRGLRPY